MIGYTQVVNKITHRSGTQMDYTHIKGALLEEFHVKAIVENIHFPVYIIL